MPILSLPRYKKLDSSIQIIFAKWIATCASDDASPCPQDLIEDGAVVLEGHRIAYVGAANKAKETYKHVAEQLQEIHLPDYHILIPGLINCHTHLPMSFLRGYSDDQDLTTWLTQYIWPTEHEIMSEEYVYQGTLIALHEAIKSGTTMMNDSYFLPEITMKAVEQAGIRCINANIMLDFKDGKLQSQWEAAEKLILKVRQDALKKLPHEDHLLRPSFMPHAAYTVPQEWLKTGAELILKLNKETPQVPVIFHTHLHETEKERDTYETLHQGKTALQIMDEAGAVNRFMVAAHCVKMTSAEIKLMAHKKANVCHCPKSNLKLASGFAPINEMMNAGVNVCLGTDGGCSNNSLDMMNEMQFAALVNKASSNDPTTIDAYTALRMATRNGAKALSRLGDLGSIEVGKLADIVSVDLAGDGNIGLPIFDPISHLVYTTHHKVTNVWVNGKRIMEDKVIKTIQIDKKKQESLFNKLKLLRKSLYEKAAAVSS